MVEKLSDTLAHLQTQNLGRRNKVPAIFPQLFRSPERSLKSSLADYRDVPFEKYTIVIYC